VNFSRLSKILNFFLSLSAFSLCFDPNLSFEGGT
jgi:hypothetical protein